jgi:hypothetical protein
LGEAYDTEKAHLIPCKPASPEMREAPGRDGNWTQLMGRVVTMIYVFCEYTCDTQPTPTTAAMVLQKSLRFMGTSLNMPFLVSIDTEALVFRAHTVLALYAFTAREAC